MRKSATLTLGACFLLVGCLSENMPNKGGVTTSLTADIDLENSHVFFHKIDDELQLLVWKGFRRDDIWELDSGTYGEKIKLKDDRTIEWEREQNTDIIRVSGQQFSLEDGRLLLLSFDGADAQVRQLDVDLATMGSNPSELQTSLTKLVGENESVRDFLDSLEAENR